MTDAYQHALDQLGAHGLVVESLDLSGRLVRCKVEGDTGTKRSGWYVAHEFTATQSGRRLIAGAFGNWKDPGCPEAGWKFEVKGQALDEEERREYERRQQEARRRAAEEKQQRAAECAARANRIWPKLPESGSSGYLQRKKVKAFGVRFSRGSMVVPVQRFPRAAEQPPELVGLQFIAPDGGKKFLTGTPKQGAFHCFGTFGGWPILFAEGYATAATVHQATGWPVVVTFDAGNLQPVMRAWRERYPQTEFIVCADDDHATEGNPGRKYAVRAAAGVGGRVLFPRFAEPGGKTDWNDLHVHQGLAEVRAQLKGVMAEPQKGDLPQGPPSAWEARLVRNQNNHVKATLHNIITVLEHHEAWAGLFALDAFANQIHRTREAPYGADPGPLTDVDGAEVAAWFGDPENYGLSVSSSMALEAVEVVATRRRFHPVIDYLDRLTWDRVPRLDRLLADFFGARFDEYTATVGRNWLMSAVARVRQPGCKVDFMVILEGDQGRGKSTAVRTLCSAAWFAEMLESPQNKDFYQVLTGRWIVEIPELQAFNKADRNKIKAAVSAQEDTYRPSYGRYARQFPRQNIFVGTTNDDAYLKDETGARRFLPVRCGEIDNRALESVRDQLWAEADARFRAGEPFWLFPEQAVEEQDARYDADAWEDPIVKWLHGEGAEYPGEYGLVNMEKPVQQTTVSDVMHWALRIEIAKHSRPDQMRVGAILRRLGWRREQQRKDGRRIYVFKRPTIDRGCG